MVSKGFEPLESNIRFFVFQKRLFKPLRQLTNKQKTESKDEKIKNIKKKIKLQRFKNKRKVVRKEIKFDSGFERMR